jgi:hypothetical protein
MSKQPKRIFIEPKQMGNSSKHLGIINQNEG